MLAGLSRSALAPVGGVLLGATMVGAIATHARLGDPGKVVARPAVLLALAVVVTAANARPGGSPSVPGG
jgi:hypothetical protein